MGIVYCASTMKMMVQKPTTMNRSVHTTHVDISSTLLSQSLRLPTMPAMNQGMYMAIALFHPFMLPKEARIEMGTGMLLMP